MCIFSLGDSIQQGSRGLILSSDPSGELRKRPRGRCIIPGWWSRLRKHFLQAGNKIALYVTWERRGSMRHPSR